MKVEVSFILKFWISFQKVLTVAEKKNIPLFPKNYKHRLIFLPKGQYIYGSQVRNWPVTSCLVKQNPVKNALLQLRKSNLRLKTDLYCRDKKLFYTRFSLIRVLECFFFLLQNDC